MVKSRNETSDNENSYKILFYIDSDSTGHLVTSDAYLINVNHLNPPRVLKTK